MNSPAHAPWKPRLPLILALLALLSHEPLKAGPPAGPTKQVGAPQYYGANRGPAATTRPAPVAQTAMPAQEVTKLSEAAPSQSATLPAATVETVDYGNFRLGGSVYSTGTGDVIVQVLNSPLVRPLPPGHNRPDMSPFNSGVYLLSPGPARFIASNKQAGSAINLGTMPAGELIFGLRVDEYNCYFQTGDAQRNPDHLDHVVLRTFKSGPMELWFEDALGPKGTDRSDRDFNDLLLSVSGGVDNGAVAGLLQAVQLQTGAGRGAAIAALKKVNPKAAANLVAESNPPAK